MAAIIERAMKFEPDARYQTADDLLVDLERVLRTHYGGAGQTELKLYLAELSRRDGQPPIGRANPVVQDESSVSGAELVEGNAVVLGDAEPDMAEEKTDLAELIAAEAGGGARFNRRATDIGRMGVIENSARRDTLGGQPSVDMFDRGENTPSRPNRRAVDEIAFNDASVVDDGPPTRYRRDRGRAWPKLLALVIIGGGLFFAARTFGWLDKLGLTGVAQQPPEEATGAEPAPAAPAAPAPETPPAAPAGPKHAKAEGAHEHPAAPHDEPAPPDKEAAAAAAAVEGSAPAPAAGEPAPSAPAAAEATPPAGTDKPDDKDSDKAGKAHEAKRHVAPSAASPSGRSNDVFKESAKRVRAISQGLDQFPPGTIELRNLPPADPAPPPPPAPAPAPAGE